MYFMQNFVAFVTFKDVTLALEEREPKLKALVEATPRIIVRANMFLCWILVGVYVMIL
jgi:hypothetical protein